MKEHTITHAYNLKYYRPKWWERLVLLFLPLKTHEQEGVVLTYKLFWKRLYVYHARPITYLLNEPTNGGINTPWMN